MFGRKGLGSGSGGGGSPQGDGGGMNGHEHVLAHLRRNEAGDPEERQRLAGHIVFDLVYRLISNERGARIEDLIAVLASTGGFSCAVAALDALTSDGRREPNDMVVIESKDGLQYVFGDLPNRFLFESPQALLSLAMGAAAHCGAALSMDDAYGAFKHVASTVGGDDFGVPRIADPHRPGDHPVNCVIHLYVKVREALDLYEVIPANRPAAIGYALAEAIEKGRGTLDPRTAALIAIECAVPAAKIHPGQFDSWKAHWAARR